MSSNKSKPFIVWVGGKRKIIDKLMEYIPSTQVGTRKKGKAYDHAGYRGINTSRRALQLN